MALLFIRINAVLFYAWAFAVFKASGFFPASKIEDGHEKSRCRPFVPTSAFPLAEKIN